jgi:uncharacterized RmlC-like cupin family protein
MYRESESYTKGKLKTKFYEDRLVEAKQQSARLEAMRKVVKAEDMPWEKCREGKIKHVCNEDMDARVTSFDAYIQEIPAGGRTGKHRHMREEAFYVLEGKGYDIHHDPDLHLKKTYEWGIQKEGKKFQWEEGDLVYIPVMVAHQHFNADPEKPARIIVANPRIPIYMGCELWEQLEDAPE